MAINFPDAPSVNDLFVSGDSTWVWNGTTWASNPSAVPLNTLGDVTISSAVNGEVVQYDGSGWVNADIIAQIVDSAPATLNTLNELAAALGDDANFATTVTNSIATKSPLLATFVTDATTARTLTASDANKTILFTSGSAVTLTINASTDFPVGSRVDIVQDGAGVLTVTASSATVAAAEVATTSGSFTIGAQYSSATLLCVATDEYRLIGNVAAV